MEAAIARLHSAIATGLDADEALWQAVTACAGLPFRTASGLEFTYQLKLGRNGKPTGELLISRKEDSKTLTKSSLLYAFHRVLADTRITAEGVEYPCYKGPKAIGQIFGISYAYSMLWRFGLIRVPKSVAQRLRIS